MSNVFISGQAGQIEGIYEKNPNKDAPTALILHSHPLYGGSMNNKVVYYTNEAFIKNHFSTLRINFRGVGRSAGTFDKGFGELNDAANALDWLIDNNGDLAESQVWIAGFSFGARIALEMVMRRPEIVRFIAIAPPANKYDMSFLIPCPAPGLIVQGGNDAVVEEQEVANFAKRLLSSNKNITYQVIQEAGHFFQGNTADELRQALYEYVKENRDDANDDHESSYELKNRKTKLKRKISIEELV